MTALLLFPVCAILWMVINAKLGLVEDQPVMEEPLETAEPPRVKSHCNGFKRLAAR